MRSSRPPVIVTALTNRAVFSAGFFTMTRTTSSTRRSVNAAFLRSNTFVCSVVLTSSGSPSKPVRVRLSAAIEATVPTTCALPGAAKLLGPASTRPVNTAAATTDRRVERNSSSCLLDRPNRGGTGRGLFLPSSEPERDD